MKELKILDFKVITHNDREENFVYIINHLIETKLETHLIEIQNYINCLFWLDCLTAVEASHIRLKLSNMKNLLMSR